MAVKTEYHSTRADGVNLYRTYSDKRLMLQKVGSDEDPYSEAIDVEDAGYRYEETDIPIEGGKDPDEATEADLLAALEELGVTDEEENAR